MLQENLRADEQHFTENVPLFIKLSFNVLFWRVSSNRDLQQLLLRYCTKFFNAGHKIYMQWQGHICLFHLRNIWKDLD
jgi:hypothetical protein